METSELKFSREDLIRKPKAKSLYSKLGITLFLMTLPTIVYIFIFHYMPLEGLLISFKDYNSLFFPRNFWFSLDFHGWI